MNAIKEIGDIQKDLIENQASLKELAIKLNVAEDEDWKKLEAESNQIIKRLIECKRKL